MGGSEFIGISEHLKFLGRTWAYTGGSDLALQVVIWTIVFNFINAVTQFVLIALDQQKYLTRAIAAVVVFNVLGNILLIPVAGYVGAALVTICSELLLFVPLQLGIRRHLGQVGWIPLVWKPATGLIVMSALSGALLHLGFSIWLTGLFAGFGYLGTLYVTGEFTQLLAQLPLSDLKSFFQVGGSPVVAPAEAKDD